MNELKTSKTKSYPRNSCEPKIKVKNKQDPHPRAWKFHPRIKVKNKQD